MRMLERIGTIALGAISVILLAHLFYFDRSGVSLLSPPLYFAGILAVFLAPTFGLHRCRQEYLQYLSQNKDAHILNRRAMLIALSSLACFGLAIVLFLLALHVPKEMGGRFAVASLFVGVLACPLAVVQAIVFNLGLLRFFRRQR